MSSIEIESGRRKSSIYPLFVKMFIQGNITENASNNLLSRLFYIRTDLKKDPIEQPLSLDFKRTQREDKMYLKQKIILANFKCVRTYVVADSTEPISPAKEPLLKWQVNAKPSITLCFFDCGKEGWGLYVFLDSFKPLANDPTGHNSCASSRYVPRS